MFGLFEKKQVLRSNDYFEDLECRVKFLEDRVKKLELKSQRTVVGQAKVLNELKPLEPSKEKKSRKKRAFLSVNTINQIQDDYTAGWTMKQICDKYCISASSYYRITEGKQVLQSRKEA